MKDCEKYKPLMMGLMDDELSPEEVSEVHAHLTRCESCREEYESLRNTTQKILKLSFKEPQDEIYEKLWKSPYSRFAKMTGWTLFVSGWLLILLYSLFIFFTSPDEAMIPKLGTAAFFIGFIILLCTVIRDRFKKSKSDRYKEVIR